MRKVELAKSLQIFQNPKSVTLLVASISDKGFSICIAHPCHLMVCDIYQSTSIYFSNICLCPSSLESSITHILGCLNLSHTSLKLCSLTFLSPVSLHFIMDSFYLCVTKFANLFFHNAYLWVPFIEFFIS